MEFNGQNHESNLLLEHAVKGTIGQLEKKPPEHTSEHVKSQNFFGGVPPDYITSHKGPYFLCLPRALRCKLSLVL